ncbi:MAG TPA: arginine--tRNA ligase [Gammaproteobacteria bacterium]|nr:arginine--tRNA ligase [Gammaproteobacteria bacterium]
MPANHRDRDSSSLKDSIQQSLLHAAGQLQQQGILAEAPAADAVEVSRTRDAKFGDFTSNLAMKLAKPAGKNPRELANLLIGQLPPNDAVEKAEIAGPGFINFYIAKTETVSIINKVLEQGANYGRSRLGEGRKLQVEFVSANPTGPLHVGHGRGAAYGAVVADLYEAIGYDVEREYYVNDAGRQMHILAVSVWLRYLELAGEELDFPANGYQGDYVWDIGATIHRNYGDDYRFPAAEVFADIPADEPAGGDKEEHIDALIERAKSLLGSERYRIVFDHGLDAILENIRRDLSEFGIEYQNWYSERTLMESDSVDRCITRLHDAGYIYDLNGALWFRSTEFGDEKDRVVKRDNGQTTYFASDIAYHLDKVERGFTHIIDVWGADHHGYVPRVRAAMKALTGSDEALDVLLIQFANLFRSGEKVQMSTRSGSFVTLRELRQEVGKDAARFFYVMRRHDQHLDFDLDLAKSQSNDNPVYYIQYAHARIATVMKKFDEAGYEQGTADLSLLQSSHESDLITQIARYPELLEQAALAKEPHQIANYLRELATLFHTYYNAEQFLVEDAALRDARITLCQATQQVIRNGLGLLGVSAPEHM